MTRKYDLPFKEGQEVEAKFNVSGFRGAWFRCRILEIKESAEPKLLLEYLDFPDEAKDWTRVRRADFAVKREPWLNKKRPSIWMVRPVPPIVHESNVEKYEEDIRLGRKFPGDVYIYNDTYEVGDTVDMLWEDCFWEGQIIEINIEKNEAKLKFPLPPHGEGNTQMAPLQALRPSLSWTPVLCWRQLGLKKREGRTGVQKCKSEKPHVRLVHLSGDSTIPLVVSDDRCGPFSSVVYARSKFRNNSFASGAKSSIKQEAPEEVKREKGSRRKVCFNSSFTMSDSDEEERRSWPIPRKPRTKDGARPSINDSEVISDFKVVDLIPSSTRALCLNASATSSLTPAARSPTGDDEMDSQAALAIADETTGKFENIGGFVEYDTTPEHLRNGTAVGVNDTVATASEDLPQVKFVIPDAALENVVSTRSTPSNVDDRNDTLSEVAVSVAKYDTITSSSAGNADSPCVCAAELAISSPVREDPKDGITILELVADKITPPVESTGTYLTMENADELGDPTGEVDGDGTSEDRPQVHLLVPTGNGTVLKNPPSPDNIVGCADGPSGARAEVYSLAHDGGTVRREEITDSVYDFDNIAAEDAAGEGLLEVHLLVSAETSTALKNPRSTHSTAECVDSSTDTRAELRSLAHDESTAHPEEITEKPYDFDSVVAEVHQTAPDHGALLFLVPDGTQVSLENTTRGDNDHNEFTVSAPSVADSETAHLPFQSLEENPTPLISTCHSRKDKYRGGVRVLDTGSEANHGESEVLTETEGCKQKSDDLDSGVASMCAPGGDLHQEQATGSPTNVVTNDASAPLSGQMKLLSHRSCVAIKKAIDIGRSRKRRWEKDLSETSQKRVCQIEPNQGVDLSVFQADGFMEEPLSSSVPSTPANIEKKVSVFESIVKPEPGTYEQENRMHVIDDSIHEPLWVLALPRIREAKFPAVIDTGSTPSTTPSDTEQQCPPDPIEKCDLEDDLDDLERLIARVHFLGAQLQRDKVQKQKKIIWKISDGSVFFSGEGDGAIFDEEANVLDVTPLPGDCLDLNYVPDWYVNSAFVTASVSGKAPDGEANALSASPCSDPDYMPGLPRVSAEATNTPQEDRDMSSFKVSRDSTVAWERTSRSRRKVSKGGTKRWKSVRNLGTGKSQSLRQPEAADQLLLLGSGNVASKVNGGLKRKQANNMGPEKDNKKMRADESTSLVEAVRNSATPSARVDLPRMRGSIRNLKEKPARLKKSKTSKKASVQGKYLDIDMGRKEKLVECVGFQQEQQLEDPLCGHIEQKSVGKSSSSGFPTKSYLSSGSTLEISSPGKLDSEVMHNESEEDRIKLQPNGNWCIKAHTVDGKLEWIGNYPTKEDALSVYDIVNRSSCPKVKEVLPPSHTSSSCLREQADGNHLPPEPALNEKQLKCGTFERSTRGNASESSSTAVEPNVGSTVFIAKEVNETAVGISRLDKTFGADEQKGEGEDSGALEIMNKSAETCEQDSSMISTKEDASVGLGVETSSGFSIEGNIQGRRNTVSGATAHNLTGGPLGLSSREKVVNADKDIQSGGIVQDKPPVKVEVSEPQAVAAAGSAHDSWIHDAVKCRYGKDALDRVSLNNFETAEEMEVARQVKMALWRGMCCSSHEVLQGLDFFKRIQLFAKSRMHFQALIEGDSNKILLSTGKPGEEIYIGHYKTETEVDAARKVISRCKKELAKSMVYFEASHNPQVSSDVLQTKVAQAGTSQVISVRKESSSSLAEATELRARPSASQATGEPSMQGLTISRGVGQSLTRTEISPKPSIAADTTQGPTSREIPCRQTLQVTHNDRNPSIQASVAPVTDHLPSLHERQALVNSRAVPGPPGSATPGSSNNIIVLDDDDDNEVHVAPVSSMLPSSTSARAFAGATPVGAISGSLNNISIQRENTVQGHRASRTQGLLNDVISSYPRQIQGERCHLAGGSSAAGQIWVRQTVSNPIQTSDTGTDPIQRVGQGCGTPDAQIYGRTLQPLRQEGLCYQQTASTPFLVGNIVGHQQPLNQYGGTARVNAVNSSGRRVEIPSSSLQAVQGPLRVTASHVPENHSREVGNSSSLPIAFNTSAAAAPRSNSNRKLYYCCPSIESCEQDIMLFKALRCGSCNRLMHTQCAIAFGRLGLTRNPTNGQEHAVYMCVCGKPWGIVPVILFRMKEFIGVIWRQQLERLNQDPHLAHPATVIELHKGQELNVIMGTLHTILSGVRSDPTLKKIFEMVQVMNRAIWMNANNVNFLEWCTFIDKALKRLEGSGRTNQIAGHG